MKCFISQHRFRVKQKAVLVNNLNRLKEKKRKVFCNFQLIGIESFHLENCVNLILRIHPLV